MEYVQYCHAHRTCGHDMFRNQGPDLPHSLFEGFDSHLGSLCYGMITKEACEDSYVRSNFGPAAFEKKGVIVDIVDRRSTCCSASKRPSTSSHVASTMSHHPPVRGSIFQSQHFPSSVSRTISLSQNTQSFFPTTPHPSPL